MLTMPKNLAKTIFWAGLLVGTLDIAAAVIQTLIHGGNPMNMLRFIASGAFGANAFEGGTSTALWGVFFHYIIAFSWTILFFLIYPTIKVYLKNSVIIAICYGIFVWLIMNFLVLPISQIQAFPFNFGRALLAAGILIVAIGLPLSLIAKRTFTQNKTTTD